MKEKDYGTSIMCPKCLNIWINKTLIHFAKFMLLNISYSLAIFGNTPKVDIKATMNENSKEIMVYNASTFKRKRKRKR